VLARKAGVRKRCQSAHARTLTQLNKDMRHAVRIKNLEDSRPLPSPVPDWKVDFDKQQDAHQQRLSDEAEQRHPQEAAFIQSSNEEISASERTLATGAAATTVTDPLTVGANTGLRSSICFTRLAGTLMVGPCFGAVWLFEFNVGERLRRMALCGSGASV
jgi:hypothetical protein